MDGRRAARAVAPRPLRSPLVTSVVAHGALIAAAFLLPRRDLDRAPPETITVDVVTDAVAEQPRAAEAAAPTAAPEVTARPAPARPRARSQVTPSAVTPAAEAAGPEAPAVAPSSEAAALEPGPGAGDAPATSAAPQAGGGAGVAGGGLLAVQRPAPPPPPRPLSETRRRDLAERYLQEILRTRIRERFRYPPEARELELAGQVVVRITLDRAGHLLGTRLAGRCPHAILCDDGMRTIRASSPFPPPPPDLGETLQIDVPLSYDFE